MDVRRRVVEARKDDLAPLRLALDLRKVESDVWSLELDARKVELDARKVELDARKVELEARKVELDLRKVEGDVRSLELDARQVELDLWRVEALALPAGLGSAPRAGDLHGVLEAEAPGAPVGFDIVGDSGA